MGKRTRLKYQAANEFGETLTKTADYTLTKNNILKDGNQFVKLTTNAHIALTLPTPDLDLDGIIIRVFSTVDSGNVTISGGFGGGGASYDYARLGAYESGDFWCNGTYWYALGVPLYSVVSS